MHDLVIIDARALLCPLPVLKLRKALRNARLGQTVCLLATDPAAEIDVPHFCHEAQLRLLGSEDRGDHRAYFVSNAPPSAQ